MSKSYVSVEQHQCFVCGKTYDTGAILLDKRLQESMERTTVTATGLCQDDQKKKDEGYIALIGADEATQRRTGDVLHIRAEVWPRIFNVPVPPKGVCFVTPDAVEKLKGMMPSET